MHNSSNKVSKAEHSVEKFPKTKRIEWIDIAKGIGIILVSFGHLRNGDGQSVWLPALNRLITATSSNIFEFRHAVYDWMHDHTSLTCNPLHAIASHQ